MAYLNKLYCSLSFVILALSATVSGQNNTASSNYEAIQAKYNFILGVNAFNSGYFSKAILAFERSMGLRPNNPQVQTWLGWSYYRNGLYASALEQWAGLIQKNSANRTLRSMNNNIKYRYTQAARLNSQVPLALLDSLKQSNNPAIQGPISTGVRKNASGLYVVDFTGNQVLVQNPSGKIINVLRGSILESYNHPFDILFSDNLGSGGFLLSEYSGNRILFCNAQGNIELSVGSKGLGAEQFLGPQFLAESNDGYFYVSDWGNKRISKWSFDGTHVFNFGGARDDFSGLKNPSGLAVRGDSVIVADSLQRKIFEFDHNGNYIQTLVESGLLKPEGLTLDKESNLLIADQNYIKVFDFEAQRLFELYKAKKDNSFQNLNIDRNNNLVAVDFSQKELSHFVVETDLYSDLFVMVDRVISNDFPNIRVDISVESRSENPIVDLDNSNFTLYEDNRRKKTNLIFRGTDRSDIINAIIINNNDDATFNALREIFLEKQTNDEFYVIRASKVPILHKINSLASFQNEFYSLDSAEMNTNTDQTIRFAVDSLLQSNKRRQIFFLDYKDNVQHFSQYDVSDLLGLMKVNKISFATINKSNNEDKSINYIVEQTGGIKLNSLSLNELNKYFSEFRTKLVSNYSLSYKSDKVLNLRSDYIPIDLGVRYLKLTGRGQLGYFIPTG